MLPPKDRRQTALFSATFPRDIQQLAQSSLRSGFEIVDTVGETEDETAEKVSLLFLTCSHNKSNTLASMALKEFGHTCEASRLCEEALWHDIYATLSIAHSFSILPISLATFLPHSLLILGIQCRSSSPWWSAQWQMWLKICCPSSKLIRLALPDTR